MSFGLLLRVYWEDTDAGGVVFYANYLKFFERARTEWLRSLGIEQRLLLARTGGMFVVSQTQLRYLRSARLDDLLHISAQVVQRGRSSLVIQQQACLHAAAQPILLCEGTIRIGWVDAQHMRPKRMPSELIQALGVSV